MNDDKTEMVHAIGLWALRLLLAGGAIYCAVTGNEEVGGTLGLLVTLSFFFL